MGRSGGDDRGASLVEFAFVLPIMLAFVMGLLTYGLTEAGDNTASSAAREGARVGILSYENAHLPGTAAHDAIVAAVDRHMGSGFVANSDVTIACMQAESDGSLSPIDGSGTCDPDLVVRGHDLIQVSVEWDPIGPVERPRRAELARMTIVGRPVLTGGSTPAPIDDNPDDEIPLEYQDNEEATEPSTPPPDCVLSAVTLDPDPVPVKDQGTLHKAVVYRAQSNGAANCGEVVFQWGPNTHDVATTASDPVPEDKAYIGALPKNSGHWSIGSKYVTAVAENGASFTLHFQAERHNA